MRTNNQLGEVLARLHSGIQRRLRPTPLLDDPARRWVHDRLLALNPKILTRTLVAQARFVVIDTETTGFNAYAGDEIVSIALIELQGVEPTGRVFKTFVNPKRAIPPESTAVHHIRDADVDHAPVIEEVLPEVVRFMGESILVGHHVSFDLRFLNKTLQKQFLCHLRHPWVDTMLLYLAVSGRLNHYSLDEVARFYHVEIRDRHTAYGDAVATAAVFKKLAGYLITDAMPVSRLIQRQTTLGQV